MRHGAGAGPDAQEVVVKLEFSEGVPFRQRFKEAVKAGLERAGRDPSKADEQTAIGRCTLELGRNRLEDVDVGYVVDWALNCDAFPTKLSLQHNRLGQAAAESLNRLFARGPEGGPPIQELHLSDNRLDQESISDLLQTVRSSSIYPYDGERGPTPLWCRLENNVGDAKLKELMRSVPGACTLPPGCKAKACGCSFRGGARCFVQAPAGADPRARSPGAAPPPSGRRPRTPPRGGPKQGAPPRTAPLGAARVVAAPPKGAPPRPATPRQPLAEPSAQAQPPAMPAPAPLRAAPRVVGRPPKAGAAADPPRGGSDQVKAIMARPKAKAGGLAPQPKGAWAPRQPAVAPGQLQFGGPPSLPTAAARQQAPGRRPTPPAGPPPQPAGPAPPAGPPPAAVLAAKAAARAGPAPADPGLRPEPPRVPPGGGTGAAAPWAAAPEVDRGPPSPKKPAPPSAVPKHVLEVLLECKRQADGSDGHICTESRNCQNVHCTGVHRYGREADEKPQLFICRHGMNCAADVCLHYHPAGRKIDKALEEVSRKVAEMQAAARNDRSENWKDCRHGGGGRQGSGDGREQRGEGRGSRESSGSWKDSDDGWRDRGGGWRDSGEDGEDGGEGHDAAYERNDAGEPPQKRRARGGRKEKEKREKREALRRAAQDQQGDWSSDRR